MKKILPGIAFLLLFAQAITAQAPQQLNYQAIVRNGVGAPLPANTTVGLKFVIHEGSSNGTIVYTEASTAITNQFGLITYQVGSLADLSVVNWSSGAEYLEVEVDPTGGTIIVMGGDRGLGFETAAAPRFQSLHNILAVRTPSKG